MHFLIGAKHSFFALCNIFQNCHVHFPETREQFFEMLHVYYLKSMNRFEMSDPYRDVKDPTFSTADMFHGEKRKYNEKKHMDKEKAAILSAEQQAKSSQEADAGTSQPKTKKRKEMPLQEDTPPGVHQISRWRKSNSFYSEKSRKLSELFIIVHNILFQLKHL